MIFLKKIYIAIVSIFKKKPTNKTYINAKKLADDLNNYIRKK